MSKTWVCADHHLGEDRFELMGRPFKTAQEHAVYLRDRHNELVDEDDRVYMLGDVCYQKTPEWLPRVSSFKGRKVLVRGNHDRNITDAEFKKYFDYIVLEGGGIIPEETPKGIPLYLTHYPTQAKESHFNLVGHIHAAWKYQLNMLNVGVDVHHFRPVDMERIPFFLEAITSFYDDDVWVAYEEVNASYRSTRGKKGKYFTP